MAIDDTTVAIIGAGPAGLAVGRELKRHCVDYVIVEKGDRPGASFSRFPRNIFLGPWLNNVLPGSRVSWPWLLRRTTPEAYAYYLREYAARNSLKLSLNTRVEAVSSKGKGFRLETSLGALHCEALVNATGYFCNPFIPPYPGLEATRIPFLHVADYRDPSSLRALLNEGGGRVLIVGKRLSAGETMVDLDGVGVAIDLSFRGRLSFGPSPFMQAALSPITSFIEKVEMLAGVKKGSFPPMAGGLSERLVRTGKVRVRPDISSFHEKEVEFVDGTRERYDAVVFATGYRPTLRHLQGLLAHRLHALETYQTESTKVPGLFFLGLDNELTYRSRFLRGIRRDAAVLTHHLLARLSQRFSQGRVSLLEMPDLEIDPGDLGEQQHPVGRQAQFCAPTHSIPR